MCVLCVYVCVYVYVCACACVCVCVCVRAGGTQVDGWLHPVGGRHKPRRGQIQIFAQVLQIKSSYFQIQIRIFTSVDPDPDLHASQPGPPNSHRTNSRRKATSRIHGHHPMISSSRYQAHHYHLHQQQQQPLVCHHHHHECHTAGGGVASWFSLVSYSHNTAVSHCWRWCGFLVLPCELQP